MSDIAEQAIFDNQILQVQFFFGRPECARKEPLRRLAFAVLLDAVHVFQTNFRAPQRNRRREFNEAREWLFGSHCDGPFSFENVCYLVEVEPSRLRCSLRRWQAMMRAGQCSQPFWRGPGRRTLTREIFLTTTRVNDGSKPASA
jgi:hypothetical protein